MESQAERDRRETDALKKMGGDAPAFGMLGTLIGLIIMLSNMGGDPSAIGPSMAVALITRSTVLFSPALSSFRWQPK